MFQMLPPGAAVRVTDGVGEYDATVMLRHLADPPKYFVVWAAEPPAGKRPKGDWVDAPQVTLRSDQVGTGSTGMAQSQN